MYIRLERQSPISWDLTYYWISNINRRMFIRCIFIKCTPSVCMTGGYLELPHHHVPLVFHNHSPVTLTKCPHMPVPATVRMKQRIDYWSGHYSTIGKLSMKWGRFHGWSPAWPGTRVASVLINTCYQLQGSLTLGHFSARLRVHDFFRYVIASKETL